MDDGVGAALVRAGGAAIEAFAGRAFDLAEPGNLDVNDGETFSYEQGATDYTNCLWTMQCPDNTLSTVAFSNLVTEGGWDFLNVFSDASLVTNSIGPAVHNGGVDNSGDLGRFSGSQDPGTITGVAAVQYITDWSYLEPGTGFSASISMVLSRSISS